MENAVDNFKATLSFISVSKNIYWEPGIWDTIEVIC
jgi:hypothetical protein